MAITAIIVTHNSAQVIRAALDCVYTHPNMDECIIIDNASTDSTTAIIDEYYPKATLIRNVVNSGFGRASNQGLERVATEFALLLNPDAVISNESINILLNSFFTCPEAAIIAPVLDKEQNFHLPALHQTIADIMPVHHNGITSVPYISGAVAMWRMKHMTKVGFFDPAFFLFYEDNDISIRTLKAGYLLLVASQAIAEHIPGRSCPATEELESLRLRSSTWSCLYLRRKYAGKCIALQMALTMAVKTTICLMIVSMLRSIQERRYRSDIQKHESLYAAISENYEQQLHQTEKTPEIIKEHEEQWTREVRQFEQKWNILQARQAALWSVSQKKKEYKAKLRAALYFLRNPHYFNAPI